MGHRVHRTDPPSLPTHAPPLPGRPADQQATAVRGGSGDPKVPERHPPREQSMTSEQEHLPLFKNTVLGGPTMPPRLTPQQMGWPSAPRIAGPFPLTLLACKDSVLTTCAQWGSLHWATGGPRLRGPHRPPRQAAGSGPRSRRVLEVPVLDAAGRAADGLGNAASPQIKTALRFEF